MAVRRGYKEEEEEEAAVCLTAANAGCGVLGDLSAVCIILIPGGGHISVWHGAVVYRTLHARFMMLTCRHQEEDRGVPRQTSRQDL